MKLHKSVQRSLLVLGGVLIAFVFCEGILRIFDLGPDIFRVQVGHCRLSSNSILGYELVPGAQDGMFFINEHGMRDRPCTMEKPKGEFRIACIGDSICYGMNVKQFEAFPRQLEDFLSANGNYRCLNFGVPGYNIQQIVEVLQQRVVLFNPDIVVYLYCLNDLQGVSLEKELLDSKAGNPNSLWARSRLIAWLKIRFRREDRIESEEVRNPEFKARLAGSYDSYLTELYESKETLARLGRGLQKLAEVSAANEIPACVVIVPYLQDVQNELLHAVHEKVVSKCGEYGIPVLDLLPVFKSLPTEKLDGVRADPIHPNAAGHRVMAEAVARHLK